MAFSAANLNCIGVGPTKVYTYYTTDTYTSATSSFRADFDTTNCPGMKAGDIVFICHNTNALMAIVRITDIDSSSCTYTGVTALA